MPLKDSTTKENSGRLKSRAQKVSKMAQASVPGERDGVRVERKNRSNLSSDYRDVYVFAVLILVLLIRPQGLLGAKVVEKV